MLLKPQLNIFLLLFTLNKFDFVDLSEMIYACKKGVINSACLIIKNALFAFVIQCIAKRCVKSVEINPVERFPPYVRNTP